MLLTWNPSAPSPEKAVGYCLYRSTMQGDAKHANDSQHPCKSCEQVNSTPVRETKCVDDVVQDESVYFYVAMAISSQQHLSTASNEVKAKIPSGKQKPNAQDLSGYTRCRVPPGVH